MPRVPLSDQVEEQLAQAHPDAQGPRRGRPSLPLQGVQLPVQVEVAPAQAHGAAQLGGGEWRPISLLKSV